MKSVTICLDFEYAAVYETESVLDFVTSKLKVSLKAPFVPKAKEELSLSGSPERVPKYPLIGNW